MFLVSENDFVDGELWVLRELLDMLDKKLFEIFRLIKESHDPDSDGLCDKGEYFIGIGFVAIQQYLVETILFTGLDKSESYKLGPLHTSGFTYVSLINSCANWWKHEPEWWNNGEIPKNGERSFLHVTNITESPSYQLSNVLASMCTNKEICLNGLVPYLEEWRTKVHENRKR